MNKNKKTLAKSEQKSNNCRKIAIISPFYPYRGGIADFSNMLCKALKKEGHNVEALTFSKMYPDLLFPGKTQFVEGKSAFENTTVKRILNSINPISFLKTAKFIKKFQPDFVIIAYWMTFFIPAYTVINWIIRRKTKVLHLYHNVIPHEALFFDKLLFRFFSRQTSAAIVLSESVKQDLLKFNPAANVLYFPHPLYNHFGEKLPKNEAISKLGLNPHKKTILFFGLIRDYKGLDLLIDTFGRLADNNFSATSVTVNKNVDKTEENQAKDKQLQLLIAGESYGGFDKYQAQIDKLPNKNDVHIFNKYISDSEVPLFFSAADICVLPYRAATQSGITMVAYHFDVPMIATNVGGLSEMIRDGETGIIVEPTVDGILAGINKYFAGELHSIADKQVTVSENSDKIEEKIIKGEEFRAKIAQNIIKLKTEQSWEQSGRILVDFANNL